MATLIHKHGHNQLKLNFAPFIFMAGDKGARLSEIANTLGISRQAATQTANKIEAAGYLKRAVDPEDGRAKLLMHTPRTKLLINQGAKEAVRLQQSFELTVGREELAKASQMVIQINKALELPLPFDSERRLILAATLPRLSEFMTARLQLLIVAKKHPGIKQSHAAVFSAIGLEGGRIQKIAKVQHVTKQTISVIANELEELGYIERLPDPDDSRQLVLWFTNKGNQFIADSVAAIDSLEDELSGLVGSRDFQYLKEVVCSIYSSLSLEQEVFGLVDDSVASNDLKTIAKQLRQQLGEEGAKSLAQLILSELTGT